MTIGSELDAALAVMAVPGPQGPPGVSPDLTPIQTQIDALTARIAVLEAPLPPLPPPTLADLEAAIAQASALRPSLTSTDVSTMQALMESFLPPSPVVTPDSPPQW